MTATLVVNEVFGPTIQGEGKSMGKVVKFIRLAGCNLACSWCDTPYTWNWKKTKFKHPHKFDPKNETMFLAPTVLKDMVDKLDGGARGIVISGGEPLLQQDKLMPLLELLKKDGYEVEIETNGTIAPSNTFLDLISQINCSPKLANSGEDNPLEKREVPAALNKIVRSKKAHFKFVVSGEEDFPEIQALALKYHIPNQDIYLMPEGYTQAQQRDRITAVAELAAKNSINFSPRLHLEIWDTRRGV